MRADGAARLRSFAAPSAKMGSTDNPQIKTRRATGVLAIADSSEPLLKLATLGIDFSFGTLINQR